MKSCEYILIPVILCTRKEFWTESKLNGFLGGFAATFALGNFHTGGEVKWAFFKNRSITFCKNLEIVS